MTDPIQSAIQLALHGLADRQRATSDNLANIQTPGYLAKTTNFETSLENAMKGEHVTDFSPTHSTSLAPTQINGNNVDLDNETVTSEDTSLRYQAMIAAMNVKFATLRSSIGA